MRYSVPFNLNVTMYSIFHYMHNSYKKHIQDICNICVSKHAYTLCALNMCAYMHVYTFFLISNPINVNN